MKKMVKREEKEERKTNRAQKWELRRKKRLFMSTQYNYMVQN